MLIGPLKDVRTPMCSLEEGPIATCVGKRPPPPTPTPGSSLHYFAPMQHTAILIVS